MSKIIFLCTLKYQKVDISKLYYSKINDSTYLLQNLFNHLDEIIKIIKNDLSIHEKLVLFKILLVLIIIYILLLSNLLKLNLK